MGTRETGLVDASWAGRREDWSVVVPTLGERTPTFTDGSIAFVRISTPPTVAAAPAAGTVRIVADGSLTLTAIVIAWETSSSCPPTCICSPHSPPLKDERAMRSWLHYTARQINREIGEKGKFWQQDFRSPRPQCGTIRAPPTLHRRQLSKAGLKPANIFIGVTRSNVAFRPRKAGRGVVKLARSSRYFRGAKGDNLGKPAFPKQSRSH